MLYQLHEMQHAALQPLASWSKVAATLLTAEVSPFAFAPGAQAAAACCELLHRLGKDYQKPDFEIVSTPYRGGVAAVRETIVASKPFCRLRHFTKLPGAGACVAEPTVLLVAPLSGHYSTLLRDTVRGLLPGHDVYVTDWTDARQVPLAQGGFRLDDYVAYVQDFMRLLGPSVHVIAICQPAVPVLGAVALMASAGDIAPRSLVLMGGPIDGRIAPTKVNQLAMNQPFAWFEQYLIHTVPANYPGQGRKVYPGFLQYQAFVGMHPDKHMQSYLDYFRERTAGGAGSAHLKFYDEYNAVLDMTAEFYLETIRTVFQDFALARGTWQVAGKPVRPADIVHTALMTVEGGQDDICGAGQTRAAHELCASIAPRRKEHLTVEGSGHFGIFSGHRWHQEICPRIAAFIARHDR